MTDIIENQAKRPRGRASKMSVEQKETLVRLFENGKSSKDIAKELKVSEGSVLTLIGRHAFARLLTT